VQKAETPNALSDLTGTSCSRRLIPKTESTTNTAALPVSKAGKPHREEALLGPDVDIRLNALAEACRKAGARVTHQRREVLRAVVETDSRPDVHTILNRIRERTPTISLDTVYRTLSLLEERDLVNRLHASGERARFDGNNRSHHHFIRGACGRILDFEDEALDATVLPDPVAELGCPTSRQLQVFGICRECIAGEEESNE
jgi:Fur family peroxide stress response transcriptional regulator